MRKGEVVWLIGASAGIGAALAAELAGRGAVLGLSARSEEGLEKVREGLAGDGHLAVPLDATSADELAAARDLLVGKLGGIDRMVYMAGDYSPMQLGQIDLEAAGRILDINLKGAVFAVETILPHMLSRGKGQVVLCGSVAGYRGLPRSQPYGASKAGLINLAESLRAEHGRALDVKVVNPGFVESRLTDKNNFDMPMRIGAPEAGRRIADGMETGRFEIHFPVRFTAAMKLLGLLPDRAYFWIMGKGGSGRK